MNQVGDGPNRELLAVVGPLLDDIVDLSPRLTSSFEDGARQFAAASLIRGSDLVRSALTLIGSNDDDAAGILARAAWESWLLGAYLLFGGQAAFLRLEGEAQRQERTLLERNSVDLGSVMTERRTALDQVEADRRALVGEQVDLDEPIQWKRLTIERMAGEVGPWIEDATDEGADVSAAYDLFYRSHSAFDTHGIRPLERLIGTSDDASHLTIGRGELWIAPAHAVAVASMYLGLLAAWICDEFGIDKRTVSSDLDRLVDALQGNDI